MPDTLAPLPIEVQPWETHDYRVGDYGNKQWIYRFANGYGASVIQGQYTYGGRAGLYELAVIKFSGKDWDITYDTPITDDVVGHLSVADVAAHLVAIAGLAAGDE